MPEPVKDWRERSRSRQRAAVPGEPTVVSSTGPYGTGGLGRHLAELVDALRDRGSLAHYVSPQPRSEDVGSVATAVQPTRSVRVLQRTPPFRFSQGHRLRLGNRSFDAAASRLLPPADHLLVFNGHASAHFRHARRARYRSVALISANSHLSLVSRQHERAYRQHPVERPWGPVLRPGNLAEYEAADLVYVSSRYAWESFVDEGFPEERLRLFPLTPHDRFRPEVRSVAADTFDVVYIGSLAVHKGVPVLVEAVGRLPHDDLRLVLVGGWGTRGMRRYIEAARARDPRIEVRPGDPLDPLARAGVCVHPSYSDGFGYAPAEALACGVPVIVTEDTGMNELVRPGHDGCIVPTGQVEALAEAIDAAYRGGHRDRRQRAEGIDQGREPARDRDHG